MQAGRRAGGGGAAAHRMNNLNITMNARAGATGRRRRMARAYNGVSGLQQRMSWRATVQRGPRVAKGTITNGCGDERLLRLAVTDRKGWHEYGMTVRTKSATHEIAGFSTRACRLRAEHVGRARLHCGVRARAAALIVSALIVRRKADRKSNGRGRRTCRRAENATLQF